MPKSISKKTGGAASATARDKNSASDLASYTALSAPQPSVASPDSTGTRSADGAVLTADALNSQVFRRALGQFATGVTVITTRLDDGRFFGLTASSFNSVSLDPPLVLWSLSQAASSLSLFTGNSHYVINVLAAGQANLAERFAQRIENRFEGVGYVLSHTGLPILEGAAAWFECHNRSRYPEGDHVIFVGEVERCAVDPQPALVFHGGQFVATTEVLKD